MTEIGGAIQAPHQRGIALRIISDNDKVLDPGSDIEELRRLGIPVRLDRTADHMHHKFAIFDSALVLTGSFNWTRSAARYNHENMVVSNDHRLVQAFLREFEKLWATLINGEVERPRALYPGDRLGSCSARSRASALHLGSQVARISARGRFRLGDRPGVLRPASRVGYRYRDGLI